MRRSRGLWLALGLGVLLLAGAAGWHRHALLARFHLARLDRAGDADRDACVEAVARLGETALPGLLDRLRRDEPAVATSYGPALARLVKTFPTDDPRRARLAEHLVKHYPSFSPAGQACALAVVPELLTGTDPAVRSACRDLVKLGLAHPDAERRIAAVKLALRPEVGQLAAVAPLMQDPAAEVRRAALLAVGAQTNLLSDEDLIRWLHDPDAEVRGLCKTALRSRGLRERDVELGRLLTHPDPLERMALFAELTEDGDLDLGVWLARLSQDPVPAVRAAAVRHATEYQIEALRDRLRQMADTDPDETTRQLARAYLEQGDRPQLPAVIPAAFREPQP
jgi:hypothetical protein